MPTLSVKVHLTINIQKILVMGSDEETRCEVNQLEEACLIFENDYANSFINIIWSTSKVIENIEVC